MRFQMMERLPETDPDAVLRAMEEGLREVSTELVREGSRITLAGLGPSPRIKNRRDRTVIDVRAEDGATTVEVDVTYQASAFLGEAPQDAVVEAKLNRVFDEMRVQLGLPVSERVLVAERELVAERVATVPERSVVARFSAEINSNGAAHGAGNGAHGGEAPVALVEEPAGVEEERLVEAVPVAMSETSVTVPEVAEEIVAVAVAQPEASVPVVVAEEGKAEKVEAQVVGVEDKSAAVETQAVEPVKEEAPNERAKEEPAKAEAAKEVKESSSAAVVSGAAEVVKASPEVTSSGAAILPAVAASVAASPVLVAKKKTVSIASGLAAKEKSAKGPVSVKDLEIAKSPESVRVPNFSGSLLNSVVEEPSGSSRALRWSAWIAAILVLVLAPLAWLYLPHHFGAETEQRAPAAAPQDMQQAPVQAAPQAAAIAQPAPSLAGSEEDPEVVVKDWESAMRATDAAKQAAFYADPVERYFLRHDVTKDQVIADKQAAIDKRQGEWNVTMERVKVTPHADTSTAVVRLVKHFTIHQGDKLISQWFVPSQLQMKRADGRWQITSERDLGWVNTMDELE